MRKSSAARSNSSDPSDEVFNLRRCLLRAIGLVGAALPLSRSHGKLTNAFVRRRIEDTQPESSDVNDHFAANVTRRCRVVRALSFDVPVE